MPQRSTSMSSWPRPGCGSGRSTTSSFASLQLTALIELPPNRTQAHQCHIGPSAPVRVVTTDEMERTTAMLGRKDYTRAEFDNARSAIDRQLAAWRALVATATDPKTTANSTRSSRCS